MRTHSVSVAWHLAPTVLLVQMIGLSHAQAAGSACDRAFVRYDPRRITWTVMASGDLSGETDWANLDCVAREMDGVLGSRLVLKPGPAGGDFYLIRTLDFVDFDGTITGEVDPRGNNLVAIHNAPGLPFEAMEVRGGPWPIFLVFRLEDWDSTATVNLTLKNFAMESYGDPITAIFLAGLFRIVNGEAPEDPAELDLPVVTMNSLWQHLEFRNVTHSQVWNETDFYLAGQCSESGEECLRADDCGRGQTCSSTYLNFYFTPYGGRFVYRDLVLEDTLYGWDTWCFDGADIVYKDITATSFTGPLIEVGDAGNSDVQLSHITTHNGATVLMTLAGVQALGALVGGLPDWLIVPQSMPGPTDYRLTENSCEVAKGGAFLFQDVGYMWVGERTVGRVAIVENAISSIGNPSYAVNALGVRDLQYRENYVTGNYVMGGLRTYLTQDCVIRGNTLGGRPDPNSPGNLLVEGITVGGGAIELNRSTGCTAEGNTFYDVVGRGIWVRNLANGNRVAENNFTGGGFGPSAPNGNGAYAIELDATTSYNILSGNLLPEGSICDYVLDLGQYNDIPGYDECL